MLKDFSRRLFFRRSTGYFLVFFVFTCFQIGLRAGLFLTDDAGSRREGVRVYPETSLSNVTLELVRLLPDGFESCPDAPSTKCLQYRPGEPQYNRLLCPTLASYYAHDRFRSNRLEDIVFITIHSYLILVAIYAVARESIPHIVFIFATNFLSAVWALARLIMTIHSKGILIRLVEEANCTSPGGNAEADFFGDNFFGYRHKFEGLLVGVSVLSVATEAHVAFKLGRIYTKRPWRVVQVSSEMRGMYRLLLGFSVVMQMTGLILPTTMGLWIDRLVNTHFRQIVGDYIFIHAPLCIFIICALPLWAALGWFALRREWKRITAVFLGLGVIILCCVLAALGSSLFIWTLTTWRLFLTFYVLTVILIIATIVLAALCRNNFDKNLNHYLMVQSRLAGSDFAHDHFEKDGVLDKGKIPTAWDPELDGKSGAGGSAYESDAEMHISYR